MRVSIGYNRKQQHATAYKSSTARFGDLVSGYYATQSSDPESQGVGTRMVGVSHNLSTGSSIHTGTWSNVMVQGNGYFNIEAVNGDTLFSRDGTFRVDKDGFLVNIQGNKVLGVLGTDNPVGANPVEIPIELDPGDPLYTSYEINKNGQIFGTPQSGGAKVQIGTLSITTFPNPEGLIRNGSNMYYQGSEAGDPINSGGGIGQAGNIISGAIEGSNVDLAEQMVNMIIYQSDYTANSKAISTASNMLETVVNLIR